MPTIIVNQTDHPGTDPQRNYLAREPGTNSSEDEELIDYLGGKPSPTGKYGLHEVFQALRRVQRITRSQATISESYHDAIDMSSRHLRQLKTGALDNRIEVLNVFDHTLPEQSELVKFIASAIGSVELSSVGINSTLMHRIRQFEEEKSGLHEVSHSTKVAVRDFARWLSTECETVSANVSDGEVLSIASVFPGDLRLYVEIERNASAGAAVTKQRRIAVDVCVSNVFDLTPEAILAAVGSV